MILTVTLVVGALLGATTIAGSLMLRQIRQSTLSTQSTQAIFAAETGIELALYRCYKDPNYPTSTLENEATFKLLVDCGVSIKSIGTSKSTSRALELRLAEVP